MSPLPATHRALVLTTIGQPLKVKSRPTPQATPGSVNKCGGINCITVIGSNTTSISINDLRDTTYTKYAKIPLENCYKLNKKQLLWLTIKQGLDYTIHDLLPLIMQLVPFGGLHCIGVEAGDKVIISPATGPFGSAAVQVALAMGASVIAMGRNMDALKKLQAIYGAERRQLVQITNDQQQEMDALAQYGPADAFFDISPPMAAGSGHIMSGILSLKHSGRVCLMGPGIGDLTIPVAILMAQNLTIKGKWMYEREGIRKMIQMVEAGVLKMGSQAGWVIAGKYQLEQWAEAFASAAQHAGPGEQVLFTM
ncbi:NAD(P)-binding protein [Aspergillus sclerotiicarbonarius CBS 121057]|uniref:NAD(P)-binding protein n=1 Tax=Aspergillus sclerotiicarbonarius (strain CBS 121057 / IBT 28362) TaxID=1448318 RepID=A0A319EGH8_ASPSB|nr:NAD(P)-binding protein [Aspergillus sclerotiicarbonarius CBS 121057]